MPTYKSKLLTLTAPKTGGKNKSAVDGFYKDSDGMEYFVKKPADQKELFTELFAGLLLQEFMSRNLVDEHYHSSLICADVIQFEDGSYGLIQPKVTFTELYKKIDTAFRDGSDRSPLWEMIAGPRYYPTLIKQGKYFGLSTSIMFSLLLGDYSVHSGNVVCLPIDESTIQYARIDWGAAFRYFAHKDNNTDILKPHEYDGKFNIKAYTKGFVQNYKNINGLFPAIAKKGNALLEKLAENTIFEIVISALGKIPLDMLSQETRIQLADYMCLDSFKNACCGNHDGDVAFAEEFSDILTARLSKISNIKEIAPENKLELYHSITDDIALNTQLSFDQETPFENLASAWHDKLSGNPLLLDIDTSAIDMSVLAEQFNRYIGRLTERAEKANLWHHDSNNNHNIMASLYQGDNNARLGYAFVAQYREGTILRHLFSIDPLTMETPRFLPYEPPSHNCTHPHWINFVTLLSAGSKIVNLLVQINKIKEMNQPDAAIKPLLTSLKKQFILFNEYRAELETDFLHLSQNAHEQAFDDHGFYPIDDESLDNMTGDQLVTICLEEFDSATPSPLIVRIIKNQTLRDRMQSALCLENFAMRQDNPAVKIQTLTEWCRHVTALSADLEAYAKTTIFSEKQSLVEKIESTHKALPDSLQDIFNKDIEKTKSEFELLRQKHDSMQYCKEKSMLIDAATTPADKIKAFLVYDKVFQAVKHTLDQTDIEHHQHLENNNNAWQAIVLHKINPGKHMLDESKLDLVNWLASLKLLNQKTFNKMIENAAPMRCLINSKCKDNVCRELLKAALSDKILWAALSKTRNRQLTPLLMQDLLILKKFSDEKTHENKENHYGYDYTASVKGFYHKALATRLSAKALPDQASQITRHAHQCFSHRHLPLRILADALLCISILGLSVLIARKQTGRTFFFTSEVTDREHCFTNKYLNNMNVLKSVEEQDAGLTSPSLS